jgi:tetratricopeptide (TPR) repeat protein
VPRPTLTFTLAALLLAAPAFAQNPPQNPNDLIENGHGKQARVLIEARARSAPNDAETIALEARLRLMTGEFDTALPLAEKAAALAPRNADYRYLVAECVGSQAQRSGPLKSLGLAKRFRKEAAAAIALDPRHVEARLGLVEFYSVAPGIAGGDDKKARAMAEEVVAIDAARGWVAKGTLAIRDKNPAQAEEAYQQALRADPKSYRTRIALARFYGQEAQKKWALAEEHAKAALALDPTRIGAYVVLAGLDAHLRRWSDLDAILAEAERAVPDNYAPNYQAGRVLMEDNRELPRAERYFRKYLTQEPEIGAPTFAHAHWRLGLVLEKQGRKSEALAEVETAMRINPQLKDAVKDLKRLKRS